MQKLVINYLNFEKALIQPTMEIMAELSIYSKRINNNRPGYLYTLYEKNKQEIRIGFNSLNNKFKHLTQNSDWIMIDNRDGSVREERLIIYTLMELGFFPKGKNYDYKYSIKLIRYLEILGWPIGSLLKNSNK